MKTYSPEEVAEMFGGDSDWWLREGIRKGIYPHLRVGKRIRLTDEHVDEIRKSLERRVAPRKHEEAPDVSVFNPSRRSRARRRSA